MNVAVGKFESKYAKGVIHPDLAAAINVAGRQRMLSQKASKEFCLIAAGLNVAENQKALRGTIDLFETSLNQLIEGDAETGITPPISEEMMWQYDLVSSLWQSFLPILEQAVADPSSAAANLEEVAKANEPLLKEINAAVWMYQ